MAWDIIATLDSPTAGAFTFTGLSLSGYKELCLEISGVRVATDGTDILLTFFVGGSEQTGAIYGWEVCPVSSSAATDPDEANGATAILLTQNNANWDVGSAAAESFSGRVNIDDPASTTRYKRTISHCSATGPTGNVVNSQGTGRMQNAGAVDGLNLKGTSNLVSGKVRLLGLSA